MIENILNSNNNENNYELDEISVNYIRGLAIDMINKAKSGHPGICLGAAPILYTLYKYHMNIDLDNPEYINRDRFVFSAGHGVPLLYSIFYFLDILTLDDLKELRQLDSLTPGHPEYNHTKFIDMSTGPLGQGVSASVGMSYASKYLNTLDNNIDYYTYVLCGDGELEEGITYESLSFAGTNNLNKLIVLLDYNKVTLDNLLIKSSIEDIKLRFQSINFNVIESDDSVESINESIKLAKKSDKPSIIIFNTTIGKYSKLEGTNIVHGKPLEEDDIENLKNKLGLYQAPFTVAIDVVNDFKEYVINRLNSIEHKDFSNIMNMINEKIDMSNIDIEYNNKSLRELSGTILNKIDSKIILSGSADLSSSCKNSLDDTRRYINFGIREQAMAGIMNGLSLCNLKVFGSTFLTFSNYMFSGIRLASLMNLNTTYIFTHDSFTVGEDGPSHHPIEQLYQLELIPNLKVYRPYDLNELLGVYEEILNSNNPSCIILPRDNKKISNLTKKSMINEGIYLLKDNEYSDSFNLIGNGEELGLLIEVSDYLDTIGIHSKVYSCPCIKKCSNETINYLRNTKTIALTLGLKDYYYKLTYDVIGLDNFTKCGSKNQLLDYYGYNVNNIVDNILNIINK